jgi:hypothetical protein
MLIQNFQKSYFPDELDESLLLHRGRLVWRQYIKWKKAKYGIKFYELCTDDVYVLNVDMYKGKQIPSNNFSAVNVLIQCKWWCKVRWYFGSVHCVFGQNEYRIFTWVLPCPLGTRDRSYTVRQCWLDNKIYCASYMQHTVLLPCYNTVHTPKIRKLYNRAYIPYFTIFQPCMHCIVFNLVLYIYIYNLQLKLIKN